MARTGLPGVPRRVAPTQVPKDVLRLGIPAALPSLYMNSQLFLPLNLLKILHLSESIFANSHNFHHLT